LHPLITSKGQFENTILSRDFHFFKEKSLGKWVPKLALSDGGLGLLAESHWDQSNIILVNFVLSAWFVYDEINLTLFSLISYLLVRLCLELSFLLFKPYLESVKLILASNIICRTRSCSKHPQLIPNKLLANSQLTISLLADLT
jgi:hypothetical protein